MLAIKSFSVSMKPVLPVKQNTVRIQLLDTISIIPRICDVERTMPKNL
jgi:hypothetical protein